MAHGGTPTFVAAPIWGALYHRDGGTRILLAPRVLSQDFLDQKRR